MMACTQHRPAAFPAHHGGFRSQPLTTYVGRRKRPFADAGPARSGSTKNVNFVEVHKSESPPVDSSRARSRRPPRGRCRPPDMRWPLGR